MILVALIVFYAVGAAVLGLGVLASIFVAFELGLPLFIVGLVVVWVGLWFTYQDETYLAEQPSPRSIKNHLRWILGSAVALMLGGVLLLICLGYPEIRWAAVVATKLSLASLLTGLVSAYLEQARHRVCLREFWESSRRLRESKNKPLPA
jgi:hypothetical protein